MIHAYPMKHFRRILLFLVVSVVPTGSAWAQLDVARQHFEKSLEAIHTDPEVLGRQGDLARGYENKLEDLHRQLSRAGNLEGVLAVRGEKERFAKDGTVEEKDVVESPPQLKQAQRIYIRSRARIDHGIQQATHALVARYMKVLDTQVRQLVAQDKVDEAVACRDELKRVREQYPLPEPAPGTPRRSSAEAALARGLELHWSFDDVKGAVVRDSSGNEHHGDLKGGPLLVDGVDGKGLRIAKPTQLVECHSKSFSLDGWTGASFSVWFNMHEATTYGTLMCKAPIGSKSKVAMVWALGGNLGSRPITAVFNCGGTPMHLNSYGADRQAHPYPPLNEWQHLVATVGPRKVSFYLNGSLDTEMALKKPLTRLEEDEWVPFTLGKYRAHRENWYDSYPNGVVDELRIWSRTLTASEVKALHERDAGVRPQD